MKPLPSLRLPADPAQPEATAETLVILLPGAYNRAQDFIAAGFAETARAAPRSFDLVLPEIDLPQLSSGEALPLIHEQLILPARAAGVSRIWLGGASLGGFNSLCYAEHYEHTPGAIDGLCLLAPWPGSRITRKLIEAAGGLDRWTPSPDELAADAELRVWHWLREQRRASVQLPIFVGWGGDDRFAGGIAAYVETMPRAHVEVVPGGHEWAPWAELWRRFCAGGAL
jgi:pimeloyl-ACP methyl ester carboxylesterase